VDFQFRVPGMTEPDITIRRSALGNVSVHVDGQELRRHGRGQRYDIPLADGTTTELEVVGQWRGLKAKVNGVETALEPPVSPIFVALIFLPLALVVIGGLIGGLIGVFASMANLVVSRLRFAAPLKLVTMVVVVAIGVGAYFAVAFALAPVPSVAVGECLNTRASQAQAEELLDPSALRPVDCATAHENEVVALITYTGEGGFPGIQALTDYASGPCVEAFEPYVGISFEESALQMFALTPSDQTWIKGHRTIGCVVMTVDGSLITGSVRGTAR
jgi:Septum formation